MESERSTRGVDILRGVAILSVVAYHSLGPVWGWYVPWTGWKHDFSGLSNVGALLFYLMTLGWVGVPLFFVISGFCIHYSFLRNGEFSAGQFFWRRFWRICPAYLAALILFTIVTHCDFHSRAGRFDFISHALFFQNVSQRTFFGINASFWSIAVEAQLYLLYPLLLGMRAKIGLPKSMAALFIIGCMWRLGSLWFGPLPDHLITAAWTNPLMTWFDWSLGVLVAERFVKGQRSFRWPAMWLIGLSALFVVSTSFKPLTAFGFMLAASIAAVSLDVALHISWRRSDLVRLLSFVGGISYSIYLFHQPLIAPLLSSITELTGSSLVAWIALLPELLVVSWLSFLLLERPGIGVGRWMWNAWHRHGTPAMGTVAETTSTTALNRAA